VAQVPEADGMCIRSHAMNVSQFCGYINFWDNTQNEASRG
jgi:hypothetical protein